LKEEVLKRLMSTRQGIPEPAAEKQDLPDLSADLYSFLFCNYKADDLVHVDAAAMSLLAALTWAVRDLLQLAHDSRIDPKEFPLCFHDKLYRHLKHETRPHYSHATGPIKEDNSCSQHPDCGFLLSYYSSLAGIQQWQALAAGRSH
jgi:hypothetical protein